MELTSTRTIAAPRIAVWAALNDPAILQRCIPGCEQLQRVTGQEWRAVIATRVGPVAVRFNARIALEDVVVPTSYTLRLEGQGGAVGFARGTARVSLTGSTSGVTELSYAAQAQVSGKLAQVGSRLIDGVAQKLADEFFANFVQHVGSEASDLHLAYGEEHAVEVEVDDAFSSLGSPGEGTEPVRSNDAPATLVAPPRAFRLGLAWPYWAGVAAIVLALLLLRRAS